MNKANKPRECRYTDATLLSMKKSELVEYIRTLEHNYDVAIRTNEQQAKNIEAVLDKEWTPVTATTKLPKPGVRVQVTDGWWVGEAYMNHNGVWMRYDSTPIQTTLGFEITHWAPFKETPRAMEIAKREGVKWRD